MRLGTVALPAVLVLLFTVGCNHNPVPIDTGGNSMTVEIPNGTPVTQTLDSHLAARVQFGAPHFKESAGIVQARVDVKNTVSETAYCEYRVIFYDEGGAEMKAAQAGWRSIAIAGGMMEQIEGTAAAPGAKKCAVYLRYEKPIR